MLYPPLRDENGDLVRLDTDAGLVLYVDAKGTPTGQTRQPTDAEQVLIDGQRADDAARPAREAAIAKAAADDTTRTGLRAKAATALDANRAYLAIAAPTTAQMRQQLERVTRQTNALIRLVVGLLDDTSDT